MRLASVSMILAATLLASNAVAQTAQTYVYDIHGRLTGVTGVVGSSTADASGYNYDPVDNRDFRRTASFNQPASANQLNTNEQMVLQQSLYSPDGRVRMAFQTDGNLALFCLANPYWATGTYGGQAAYLAMQGDGNLVIYSGGGGAVWASGSSGSAPVLAVQNDGNLVIYGSSGVLWSSMTSGSC